MFQGRKGTVLDTSAIVLLLFIFVVVLFLVATVWSEFVGVTSTMDIFTTNANATGAINLTSSAFLMFDYIVLFYLIAMGIGAIIFSYYVESHPVMFIASLISLMISIILGVLFTNVFVEMSAADAVSTVTASYPLTVTLMQNLPGFIALIGTFILIALAKRRKE